ncbi:MAG: M50 family metallopeptidase [Myxococcales bacterium]|nr:M50 family metallopeptidase [Myxococcales bacterium]
MADQQTSYKRAFWGAVIVTLVLWIIPFGGLVIYPFSLLATWAHELGHGITALITGGSFHGLELTAGLGGLAATKPAGAASSALISVGGLVGAPILGAIIVALGARERLARVMLVGLAGLLVISVALWVKNGFGIVACIAIAAGLGVGAFKLSARRRFMLVQLLGIQLSLSALRNWQYLFMQQAGVGSKILPSDVANIQKAIGGHYLLWGVLIFLFNSAVLYGAYRLARRHLRRAAAAGAAGAAAGAADAAGDAAAKAKADGKKSKGSTPAKKR